MTEEEYITTADLRSIRVIYDILRDMQRWDGTAKIFTLLRDREQNLLGVIEIQEENDAEDQQQTQDNQESNQENRDKENPISD
jgi:hypothetical protein